VRTTRRQRAADGIGRVAIDGFLSPLMRPLRFLILVLVLAAALFVALIRPLPGRAGETTTTDTTTTTTDTTTTTTDTTTTETTPTPAGPPKKHRHHRRRHHVAKPLGAQVVHYARKFIGVPYEWGGSSPRTGFDCSGFVRYVYQHFGFSLPHSSYGQMSHGRYVLRKYLKPGDILFFEGGGHVGIYVGRNRVIDAPHSGSVVHVSTMAGWYSSEYDSARRLAPAS
jgi:cell wall-associated NlpC family hydrolase